MSFEDFQDLMDVGYQGGGVVEKKEPEQEDFHSIYIAGKQRENHLKIVEKPGLFQIRGFQYNLEKVHIIVTHTKDILAKIHKEGVKEITDCFSFKEGSAPWFGNTLLSNGSKRQCPNTSAERLANDFCKTCKSQIIVAGIICNENGSPMLTEDKKPAFGFIRGKASRYQNVSNYLNEMYQLELPTIFTPVTDQSKHFEKTVVNNKRFVTSISKGTTTTSFGNDATVFVLTKGVQIPNEVVLKILKISKDTVEKFNEKFDWSKKNKSSAPQRAEGIMTMETEQSSKPQTQREDSKKDNSASPFNFDDISW